MKKVVAQLGLVLGMISCCWATVRHVPMPYATIQSAINASIHGDTVLVHPGTYQENVTFGGRNILICSEFAITGDTAAVLNTIIDGNSTGSVVRFENGEDSAAAIVGFTLRNGLAIQGGGVKISNGSRPKVMFNAIYGNQAGQGGAIYCAGNATLAYNAIFYNFATDGGGIYCATGYSPRIERNALVANAASLRGGAMFTAGSSAPLILHLTISRNMAATGGGMAILDTSTPTVVNSILWDDSAMTGPEIFVNDVAWATVNYSDVEGGFPGTGNINCDPRFCDPAIGNYYIRNTSCCVGAGQGGADIGALGVGCYDSCIYVVGDINGDGQVRGSDVTYGVRYFKGAGPPPPDSCFSDSIDGYLYVAGDVNGNCEFRGSDITRLVAYFKGVTTLLYCPYFPPPAREQPVNLYLPLSGLRDWKKDLSLSKQQK